MLRILLNPLMETDEKIETDKKEIKDKKALANLSGEQEEEKALIWLGTSSVSAAYTNKLLQFAGSAEKVYQMDREEMEKVVPSSAAARLWETHTAEFVKERLAEAQKLGAKILTRYQTEYPRSLLALQDPPPVLYYKGTMPLAQKKMVAIVGTRTPSRTGERTAQGLARELSLSGACIVSGLARGIDAFSHTGALQGTGGTIAVIGTGIDEVYPPENEALYRNILENGCVVSEFVPGSKPLAWHFPLRNRLIAALSQGVIVVEGELRSGAYATVRSARAQRKPILVPPAPLYQPFSALPLSLLSQGATLITQYQDVGKALLWQEEEPKVQGKHGAKRYEKAERKEGSEEKKSEGKAKGIKIEAEGIAAVKEKKAKKEKIKKDSIKKAKSKTENKGSTLEKKTLPQEPKPQDSKGENRVVQALYAGERSFDELCESTGLDAAKLNSILTMLTLRSIISKSQGGFYRLT